MKIIAFVLALAMAAGMTTGAQARSGSVYWSNNRISKKNSAERVTTWRVKYDRLISRYEQHQNGCPCGTCKSSTGRNWGRRVVKFETQKSRSHHEKEQLQSETDPKDGAQGCNEDHNSSRRYRKRISGKKHNRPGHICRNGRTSFSYYRPAVIVHSAHRQAAHFYHEYSPPIAVVNKQEYISSIAVNTFQFNSVVRRRACFISKAGIADELLADSSFSFDEYLEYRSRTGEVVVAASPENTSRLLTIINDYDTFRAYLAFQSGKTDYRVDVVSVVDRELIMSDPEAAGRIAFENVSNIERLLGVGKHRNKFSAARMWYNPMYGTVTMIDRPEKIEKVKELMLARPYFLARL